MSYSWKSKNTFPEKMIFLSSDVIEANERYADLYQFVHDFIEFSVIGLPGQDATIITKWTGKNDANYLPLCFSHIFKVF